MDRFRPRQTKTNDPVPAHSADVIEYISPAEMFRFCDICLIIRDSVTCHPTQVNAPRLNPRGIGKTSRLSVRPSVRLSVCLSVKLRYTDHISWKSCGCTKQTYVWSSEVLLYRNLATPQLVVNVVDELKPKRIVSTLRGFLAVARLSCIFFYLLTLFPILRGRKSHCDAAVGWRRLRRSWSR